MSQPSSLAIRAALAVLLMVGFYALAVGSAVALLGITYTSATAAADVNIKLVFVCGLLGGLILWAVLPRWDTFDPPGPRLTASEHPELFVHLNQVAQATGQAMPVEVYLVSELNAFVAERGGIMGVGSRRVMGLGLPLLQLLTVTQLRAVLAHEFGHFDGGDTKLGPWIYKTRSALGRTITTLAELDSYVHKPFEWYGVLFLRITQAISRRQEYSADALAGRIVGPQPLIDGLTAVHGGALAFDAFYQSEYVPMLESGYRPPLALGFREFVDHKNVEKKIGDAVDQELESGKTTPYDTHPPLRDRVAALAALPKHTDTPDTTDTREAIALVTDVSELERRLLGFLVPPDAVAALEELSWDDAVSKVYQPSWNRQVAELGAQLAGCTPSNIFSDDDRLFDFAEHVIGQEVYDVPKAHPIRYGAQCAASAIAVALIGQGWCATAPPGAPTELRNADHTLRPFSVHTEIATGDTTHDQWISACEAAGVAELELEPVAETGP